MINDRLRGGVSYPEGVSGLSPGRLRRLRRARLGLRTHIPERVAPGLYHKKRDALKERKTTDPESMTNIQRF
jgi:hypothetical protein